MPLPPRHQLHAGTGNPIYNETMTDYTDADTTDAAPIETDEQTGGLGLGQAAAIAQTEAAWGIPRDITPHHTFKVTIDGISNNTTLNLAGNTTQFYFPMLLDTYFDSPTLHHNSATTLYPLSIDKKHLCKVDMCELKLMLLAVTRERTVIQNQTMLKARDFFNAPLCIGEPTNKSKYLLHLQEEREVGRYLPDQFKNYSGYQLPYQQETFMRNSLLNVGETKTWKYINSIPNRWAPMDFGKLIFNKDETKLRNPYLIPNYTLEGNSSNLPVNIITNQLVSRTQNNYYYYVNHKLDKGIQPFGLYAPNIQGEDGNPMQFNYTLRWQTKMIVTVRENSGLPITNNILLQDYVNQHIHAPISEDKKKVIFVSKGHGTTDTADAAIDMKPTP